MNVTNAEILSPYFLRCLNSKHHPPSSCLTLWSLTLCLSILFWLSACEQACSHDFGFVGAVEISSLRLYDYDKRAQSKMPKDDIMSVITVN